jgi:hypothetical protein
MKFENLNSLETLELKASPAVVSVAGILVTTSAAALKDDDGPPEPEPAPPPDPGDNDPIVYPVLPPSGPAGPGL